MTAETPHDERRCEELRRRADAGDAEACIELGDLLLATAPYASCRWEDDPELIRLRANLGYANLLANDAFEVMTVHWSDKTRFPQMEEGYLACEASVQMNGIAIARRREELGCDTPGRREALEEAFQLFRRAAEMGDPLAMDRLAWRYCQGQGTGIDKEQAEYWWRAAGRS